MIKTIMPDVLVEFSAYHIDKILNVIGILVEYLIILPAPIQFKVLKTIMNIQGYWIQLKNSSTKRLYWINNLRHSWRFIKMQTLKLLYLSAMSLSGCVSSDDVYESRLTLPEHQLTKLETCSV